MRRYIKIMAVSFALLSLTIVSCKKDFLEVVPKGKLIATTYNDYDLLMNGSNFYLYYYAGIWQPAMLMGDEVAASEAFYNNAGPAPAKALFQWSTDVFLPGGDMYTPTDDPAFIRTLLTNIYTCNKIINEVANATGGTDQQKLELKSEAMAQRAYIYFQLINYFGKPYAANTASTDPGWPIVTSTDISASDFKRNSVQEVYDFMIKDLTDAIPNLQTQPAIRTRMSRAAAEGMLGKLYVFMGKYADAKSLFDATFNDIGKMSSPPQLIDYNAAFAAGGPFLPINPVSGPNSPFNGIADLTESVLATMSYAGSNMGNGFGNDFLLITPQTAALFDPSDWRLQFYTNIEQDQATPIPGGLLRKYGMSYARIGLELPELYLLRAECEARAGDLSGAKADVEALRKNRMPVAIAGVPSAAGTDKTAMVKFIIDERIREFAVEGYRWFDMRRLSTDPIFSGQPGPVHSLYLTGGGTTQFTLTPQRLTLRIPTIYLKSNPGMVDNP